MGIKGLLGFCECKGCKNRMEFEMEVTAHLKSGDKKIKKARICGEHAKEQMKSAHLKSVTVENTIDFE